MPHSYEPPKRSTEPSKLNEHVLAYSVTITLICILTLGIPLAAMLPPLYIDQLAINILVPLYSSPAENAWDSLYSTVISHSDLSFTIIISPDNGPGQAASPPSEYISAIKRLNTFPNVRTLGYINTSRGTRANSTILSEIERYAGWINTSGLAMHGIFFDETPFEGTTQNEWYLRKVSMAAKHANGLQWPRMVVHNPGVVPSAKLTSSSVDVTVVYEGMYEHVESREVMKRRLAKMQGDRSNYAMVVYSLPERIGRIGVRKLINSARQNVKYICVTTLVEQYGKGLGSRWEEFLSLTW